MFVHFPNIETYFELDLYMRFAFEICCRLYILYMCNVFRRYDFAICFISSAIMKARSNAPHIRLSQSSRYCSNRRGKNVTLCYDELL